MFSISAFKEWAAPCFHYRPRAAWPVMGVVLLLTGGLLLASMKDYQRRDALQRQHQHLLETVAKRDEIVRGLSARMKKTSAGCASRHAGGGDAEPAGEITPARCGDHERQR